MSLSKGRLSVLLVFTLVLVSTQCAALCAFESCNGSQTAWTPSPADDPPCHHHEAPGQSRAPCAHHQIVVQGDVAQPLVTPVLTANVLVMDVSAALTGAGPSLSGVDVLAEHAPSPPSLAILSSVVLRI
jgi:hypothetical protein